MNFARKALLIGMFAVVFASPAIAHDVRDGNWSGGVTVAVTPAGNLALSGGLAYGPVVAYAARPMIVAGPPVFRPVFVHPSQRRHAAHGRGHQKAKRYRHEHAGRH